MRPTLRRLLRLSNRYKLVDSLCPEAQIKTATTLCPCSFPPDKPIDYEKPLYGTKAVSWKHALVHSDIKATEWESRVELMPHELISKMSSLKRSTMDPMHPVLISNVELEKDYEGKVLVFPDNKVYDVTEESVQDFMKEILRPDGDISKIPNEPHKGRLILICGHEQRDIRCGQIAPILRKEFEFNLKKRGLLYGPENLNGVKVGIVSHIGGHVYAGNVVYFDEDGLAIWYGRCEAKHVDGLIRETIIEKNVIKELFRGRFH
jgi:hypothetical protein